MAKKQATSRIIAGSYKGTKLSFKPNKNLRPTESKTKETLFNWLLNDLHKKKCLDMFAGTGALGLEALSRGADEVVFFEKQKALCGAIEVVVKKLGINNKCRVINANSTAFDFTTLNTKFDLIFLDPPFHESLIQKSLNIISENQLLTEQGLVYIECERDLDLGSLKTDLTQLKLSKGGETKSVSYTHLTLPTKA